MHFWKIMNRTVAIVFIVSGGTILKSICLLNRLVADSIIDWQNVYNIVLWICAFCINHSYSFWLSGKWNTEAWVDDNLCNNVMKAVNFFDDSTNEERFRPCAMPKGVSKSTSQIMRCIRYSIFEPFLNSSSLSRRKCPLGTIWGISLAWKGLCDAIHSYFSQKRNCFSLQ